MSRDDETQQALAQIGATILGRYQHPSSWHEEYAETQPKPESMVLRIRELDPQQSGLDRSRLVARAIRTWSTSVGLPAGQIRVPEPHISNYYRCSISVPFAVWTQVLLKLKALNT